MNCHDESTDANTVGTRVVSATPQTAGASRVIALAGNPNSGKSTLFSRLTGVRQKIANYPGVTVEKKTGRFVLPGGKSATLVDLPGAYSLKAITDDEKIAVRCIQGQLPDVGHPDTVLVVVEAVNLDRGLVLFRQIQGIHPRVILAVNMMDELRRSGKNIDAGKLAKLLAAPVVPISARTGEGVNRLLALLKDTPPPFIPADVPSAAPRDIPGEFTEIDRIMTEVVSAIPVQNRDPTDRLDSVFLNPVAGPLIFLAVMFILFQALFSWSAPLMDLIEEMLGLAAIFFTRWIAQPWIKSLIGDGIIAGVGSVLVFVPQIAIAFLLIGFMETSGYLARGAFLADRFMRLIGLEGRAFLPLISSFACAVPGIMSARTLPDTRQRLITILIAPLMTCSARLPVYTLLIATFIPDKAFFGWIGWQGLTLFALFLTGILAGAVVAFVIDKVLPGGKTGGFFLELPRYRLPTWRNLSYYASFRTTAFIKTAGTTIFLLSVVLWFFAYFPRSEVIEKIYEVQLEDVQKMRLPDLNKQLVRDKIVNERDGELLRQSFLGHLGLAIEPLIRPLGYDWRLGIGILSSFAAREVFVSTLGIIFNVGKADELSGSLRQALKLARTEYNQRFYSLATALSLLVFFALAAQCISTLSVIHRETGSVKWPIIVFVYMTLLAYGGAWVTYAVASRM